LLRKLFEGLKPICRARGSTYGCILHWRLAKTNTIGDFSVPIKLI